VPDKWFTYATGEDIDAAAAFPEAFLCADHPNYEYPRDATPGWGESAQGVTHDGAFWYISQEKAVWRIPRGRDLAREVAGDTPHVGIPDEIGDQGGNHFGDLDWHEGRLYVPLEGAAGAQVVVFEAPSLEYEPMFSASLAQGESAPWCAIDPRSGILFSSRFDIDENGLYAYQIDVSEDNGVEVTLLGRFPLFDESGAPMRLTRAQGAVFSDMGHLYLATDAPTGVLGFDMCTGRLVRRIGVDYQPQKHIGVTTYQEVEGLTLWDLDDGGAPNIGGQLHVIVVDNAPLSEDRIYFKHYEAAPNQKTRI
jgi:hypothetical protein